MSQTNPARGWVLELLALLAGWLAPVALAQDAPPAGPYKLGDGPHEVVTVPELVLHDDRRGKDMAVLIHHPEEGGPYPVILFPAGASGQKEAYDRPSLFWASLPARRSPRVVVWLAACCCATRLSASRCSRSLSARIDREIFCSTGSTRVTGAVTVWPGWTTSSGFSTRSDESSEL